MITKIIQIVKDASKIMNISNFEVHQKGDASNLVTSADIQVQEYLIQHLLPLVPGSSVIGEEDACRITENEYTWIIDPIDGTSNFIRDLGLSAISVGLFKDAQPYIGIIYFPYRDEMFWAEKGKGAFLNGRPIRVSDRDFAHSHLCSAMCIYDKSLSKPCFHIIEKVYAESDDFRRLGSAALELAHLAAGRVELYFEIRLFPWDVAAAATIIQEAGGYIEFLFHDTMPLDTPFAVIAANTEENFEKLRSIVYEEIPTRPY